MRITKRWLRECKTSFIHRSNELHRMDARQICTEYARCFPHAPQLTDEREALRLMILDLISLCIPDHMVG